MPISRKTCNPFNAYDPDSTPETKKMDPDPIVIKIPVLIRPSRKKLDPDSNLEKKLTIFFTNKAHIHIVKETCPHPEP